MKQLIAVNTVKAISYLALDVALMGIFAASGAAFDSILLKLFMALAVGRQLHAIGIIYHDAAHFNISRNHAVNDGISDWFISPILMLGVRPYRALHNKHHAHMLTEKDPDLVQYRGYPMSIKKFVKKLIFKDLTGISYLRLVMYFNYPKDRSKLYFGKFYIEPALALRGLAFHGTVGFTFLNYASALDLFLLWILPLTCILPMMTRVRAAIEHGGLMEEGRVLGITGGTRTTPSTLVKLLFCPHNIGYHTEHHFHPAVPFYNLPELSRKMEAASMGNAVRKYTSVREIYQDLFGPRKKFEALEEEKEVESEIISKIAS